MALIGFAALQLGAFSRFGVWRQILLAVLILIFLELMRGLVSEPIVQDARMWPLTYVPSLVGLAIASLFLWLAAHPVLRKPSEGLP